MSSRYVTLLVVPHDEHDVRRFRLSYRRLATLALVAATLLLLVVLAALAYGRMSLRAARTAELERENVRLAAENAKVERIAANLERTEGVYRQIRALSGLSVELTERPENVPAKGADPPAPRAGVASAEPSGWPLAIKGFTTDGFSGLEGHPGIDIAVPENTPVLATALGVVRQTGSDKILGKFVVLGHPGGLETMYAHNAHLLVERGRTVERGETIAYSGTSGRSSAPHLHYEVRRDGLPTDPEPYLP